MSNQFVKNTNFLPDEHPLTQHLGRGWKISTKTNVPYKDIALISDSKVKKAAVIQSTNPVTSDDPKEELRDYISYELPVIKNGQQDVENYWFWITDFSGNGKFNIYAFDSEADVIAKRDESIKFAGYSNKTIKPTDSTKQVTTLTNSNNVVSNKSTFPTHQVIGNDVIGTVQEQKSFIKTVEDLKVVTIGTPDYVGYLEKGYSIVPVELANPNIWKESCYDNEGNLVGFEYSVLLGRLINLEIPKVYLDDQSD